MVDATAADAALNDAQPATAVAFVDITDRAPMVGATTSIVWSSQNADTCSVFVDNSNVASGTSGTFDITVGELTTAVRVQCLPQGLASVARMPVASACVATVIVGSLSVDFNGVTDGAQQPFTFQNSDCIEVTGTVTFAAPNPLLSNRIRSAHTVFEMVAGTHGQGFARLENARFMALDYCNGGDSGYTFPVLAVVEGSISLLSGRADLRALPSARVLVRGEPLNMIDTPVLVLDLAEDIESFEITGRDNLPILTAPVLHVAGDVNIHDTAIPRADIDAFLDQLGVIRGIVTICNNLDDAACM